MPIKIILGDFEPKLAQFWPKINFEKKISWSKNQNIGPILSQKSILTKTPKLDKTEKSLQFIEKKTARFARLFFDQANVFLTRQVAGIQGKTHLLG